jgi:hypothetical protein
VSGGKASLTLAEAYVSNGGEASLTFFKMRLLVTGTASIAPADCVSAIGAGCGTRCTNDCTSNDFEASGQGVGAVDARALVSRAISLGEAPVVSRCAARGDAADCTAASAVDCFSVCGALFWTGSPCGPKRQHWRLFA